MGCRPTLYVTGIPAQSPREYHLAGHQPHGEACPRAPPRAPVNALIRSLATEEPPSYIQQIEVEVVISYTTSLDVAPEVPPRKVNRRDGHSRLPNTGAVASTAVLLSEAGSF